MTDEVHVLKKGGGWIYSSIQNISMFFLKWPSNLFPSFLFFRTRKRFHKNLWGDRWWLSQLQLHTAPKSTPGILILARNKKRTNHFRLSISLKNLQKYAGFSVSTSVTICRNRLGEFKRKIILDRLGLFVEGCLRNVQKGRKLFMESQKESTSKVIDSKASQIKENIRRVITTQHAHSTKHFYHSIGLVLLPKYKKGQ